MFISAFILVVNLAGYPMYMGEYKTEQQCHEAFALVKSQSAPHLGRVHSVQNMYSCFQIPKEVTK